MSKLKKAQSKTGRNERITELEKSHDKVEVKPVPDTGRPGVVKKGRVKGKGKHNPPKRGKGPDGNSGKRRKQD